MRRYDDEKVRFRARQHVHAVHSFDRFFIGFFIGINDFCIFGGFLHNLFCFAIGFVVGLLQQQFSIHQIFLFLKLNKNHFSAYNAHAIAFAQRLKMRFSQ